MKWMTSNLMKAQGNEQNEVSKRQTDCKKLRIYNPGSREDLS